MKKIILFVIVLLIPFLVTKIYGQDDILGKIQALRALKSEVVNEEKEALKITVENINKQLNKGEITQEEAKKSKEEEAKKRALNIENKLAILENRIFLLERNGDDVVIENVGKEADEEGFSITIGGETYDIVDWAKKKVEDREIKYDRRTYSDFVFALGLNNAIIDGASLNDTPYKTRGTFYEVGVAWHTRVFENSNFLRFRYGISYQFNGLRIDDNNYFVANNGQTELQEFEFDLRKAKFRRDNLVFPVHFEFGPSNFSETEKTIRYNVDNKFRVGLGGYAGVNVSTRQKLRYRENGKTVKSKLKGGYNTSNFIYGLSAYAGFGDCVVYLKYDLNPIFDNATIEQRNISLGFRFDL